MKLKINIKILLAFLGLSLISLILFGYISFKSMRGLGVYALKISNSLGDKAVDDSIYALENQAKSYLLRLAESQAALSNALLEKVEDEVEIIASFASNIWSNSFAFAHEKSYSQEEKPSDIYLFSSNQPIDLEISNLYSFKTFCTSL